MTMAELEEKTGVRQPTLRKVIDGIPGNIQVATLKKIAGGLPEIEVVVEFRQTVG